MSDTEIPAHLIALLQALESDPGLGEGARSTAGELTGRAAVEATVEYYRSAGFAVTVEELTALEIARKESAGEALSEYELEAVAGGALYLYTPSIGQYHWPTNPSGHTVYWSD